MLLGVSMGQCRALEAMGELMSARLQSHAAFNLAAKAVETD